MPRLTINSDALNRTENNNGALNRTGNNGPQGEISNGSNNFRAMNYDVNSVIVLVTQQEIVAHSPIITSKHVPTLMAV